MSEKRILGKISYIFGIIIIVVFLFFAAISLIRPILGFVERNNEERANERAVEITQNKVELCEKDGGVYFPYEGRCVYQKDPQSVVSVCEEWDRKNIEHKEKIEKSVEYLNSIITEEQKLIIDLWSTIFNDPVFYYEDGRWAGLTCDGAVSTCSTYSTYDADNGYFKKHIIPVWIEKEEQTTAKGEKYLGFHISYSVRMGDWYRHEVGNFTNWAGANWVVVKESDYKSLIEAIKKTTYRSQLLKIPKDAVAAYDRFSKTGDLFGDTQHKTWSGFWGGDRTGPTNVAEFKDFSGVVIAQKHRILEQGRDCVEMISLLRSCDSHLKIANWDNRYTAEGIDFNTYGGISISARSGFEENRTEDCHKAELNLISDKLDCFPVDCDPYGGKTGLDFTM